MSSLSRRDFVKHTSVATGGALLSLSTRAVLAQGVSNTIVLPLVSSDTNEADNGLVASQFKLFVTPSAHLELITPSGIGTGLVTDEIVAANVEIDSPEESLCLDEICTQEFTKEEAYANLAFAKLVSDVPVNLLPLVTYPLSTLSTFAPGDLYDLSIIPRADVGQSLDPNEVMPLDEESVDAGIGRRIGNYYIRVSAERGFIGGCIRRTVPHAGLLVHYIDPRTGRGRQIFNLHIASWWQGWRPCVGVYESSSGFCRKACSWNIWRVIYSLVLAVAALYVVYWIAQAIAAVTATAALGILIAAPGVPPPP